MTKYMNRLAYINYMIKRKSTGSLRDFARRNGVSTRTLSGILNEMKSLGFPVKFDRMRNTYYYDEDGQMIDKLFFKYGEVLNRDEMEKMGISKELCFSEKLIFVPCENI